MDTTDTTPSIAGVFLQNVQVGGNLTISGVTVQLPAKLPPLWVNVPSLPNHFLGRDVLVDDLVARLLAGHSPALSAEGLPGVGKTTLAVVLAHHPGILAHFSDGVLWAGLGPSPDVPSQLAAWATALGIDVSDRPTSKARAQAVRNEIGQRRLLLVIDDAWQAESADLMRCGGPGCSHLLTTRDQAIARHFAGVVQSVSVPTLADDPAFDLLQALAPEACAADLEAARALARTVDGLPLALELLGGYLAAPERSYFAELSATAFDELADPARRLQLATRRLGASDDAQVTLQATIALSLSGLPEEVVAAFHALGAFAPKPATFSLEAAKAVIGAGAASGIKRTLANIFRPKAVKTEARDSTATVALLVARNLLERSDGERLALHQVLADVTRTKLESAAIERHRDYYLALVDEEREDWQCIQAVYPQVQQAVAWQLSLRPGIEGLIEFYRSLQIYFQRQGLWADFRGLVEKCLELARRSDNIGTQAWLLNDLGYMYSALGEKQEALAYYEQALPLRRQVGDRSGEATTLNNMAWVLFHQGDLERALDMFAEVGRTLHEIGAVAEEAALLFNLAFVLGQYLGRQGEAIEHLTRSVEILHRYHLPQDAAGQTLAQHEAFLAQLLAAQELSEDEDE